MPCSPSALLCMGKAKRRAAVAASCLAIVVGACMFVMGQGGVEQNLSPTFPDAVVEPEGENEERTIDWVLLPESVIVWVYIPGTSVDYPVAMDKEDDPGFYLFHDAYDQYSVWGTPYIANGCKEGLESPLVMIYGHHMSDGSMFAPVASFSNQTFAEEHDVMLLYTREGTLHLRPALVNVINANRKQVQLHFEGAVDLAAYMADEREESEVVMRDVPDGARVHAFVTRSYETSNSRTVVYAIEVEQ